MKPAEPVASARALAMRMMAEYPDRDGIALLASVPKYPANPSSDICRKMG